MNSRDIELFEPSKIMGDVFEALIGAIFIDGGIKEVLRVYQHLFAPFLLHVAKFSKNLFKEPKEDFAIMAKMNKISPQWPSSEVFLTVEQLGAFNRQE